MWQAPGNSLVEQQQQQLSLVAYSMRYEAQHPAASSQHPTAKADTAIANEAARESRAENEKACAANQSILFNILLN